MTRGAGTRRKYSTLTAALIIYASLQASGAPQNLKGPVDAVISRDYRTAIRLLKNAMPHQGEQADRATLLLGYCYYKVGEYDRARETLLKDISHSALLKHYRLYYAGRSSYEAGEHEPAAELFQKLQNQRPTQSLKARSMYLLSFSQIELERYSAASKTLDTLETLPGRKAAWDPDILYLNAQTRKGLKNNDLAERLLKKLWIKYPLSKYAAEAEEYGFTLDEKLERVWNLKASGNPSMALAELNPLIHASEPDPDQTIIRLYSLRAQIYMSLRNYTLALHQIDRIEKLMEESDPKLLYEKAKALSRLDRDREAIQIYRQIHSQHPDSSFAPRSLHRAARLCQIELRHNDATRIFKELVRDYPKTEQARDAHFQIGWICYLEKRYKKAAQYLEKVPEIPGEPIFNARTLYWRARSLDRSGKPKEAAELQQKILDTCPNTPYALFLTDHFKKNRIMEFNTDSPGTEHQALSTSHDCARDSCTEHSRSISLDSNEKLILPSELVQIGLRDDAIEELKLMERKNGLSDEDIMAIARLYLEARDYFRAHRLAHNKFRGQIEMNPGQYTEQAKLAFPLAYADLVNNHANNYGLDPFLILSLIHAESRFKPDAISSAGALGLMQIMPYTGKRLARELGESAFSKAGLTDPDTNIKYGCFYLAKLIKYFQKENPEPSLKDLVEALASYNAGEDKVKEWKRDYDKVAPEPDEFIEMIPYMETRLYIRKVLTHYALYHSIYSPDS